MKRNIVNYIKEYGISLFITKGIRRLYLKSNSVLATKINAYNEDNLQNSCQERLEKQRQEDLDMELLAENEKKIKKLWDQYSVSIHVQF